MLNRTVTKQIADLKPRQWFTQRMLGSAGDCLWFVTTQEDDAGEHTLCVCIDTGSTRWFCNGEIVHPRAVDFGPVKYAADLSR
jgi:hypothetical protein